MPKESSKTIEGFVLAGGGSRRMGRDKSALVVGGLTLIERAAAALSEVAEEVFAVGNLETEQTSLSVVRDEEIGGGVRGAMIGLYTAAVNSKTEWIAVLACDMPFVSGELLQRLAAMIPNVTETIGAVLPEQPDGRIQPLCGFYRTAMTRIAIEKMLSQENRRLQDLAGNLGSHIVPFADIADLTGSDNFFLNLNSPADHAAAVEAYESHT